MKYSEELRKDILFLTGIDPVKNSPLVVLKILTDLKKEFTDKAIGHIGKREITEESIQILREENNALYKVNTILDKFNNTYTEFLTSE